MPNKYVQSPYGAKAQNLIGLQQLGILIPAIHPLSHQDILNIFRECGLDIASVWNNIILTKPAEMDLDTYVISISNAEPLEKLRGAIIRASNSKKFKYLLSATSYGNKTLQKFIDIENNNAAEIEYSIMCRSSGDEDLTDVSNPGGNESHVATPTIEDIAKNIGLVVASYFKAKSFGQRQHNTDSLGKLPQCSVLLQTMIGENSVLEITDSAEPTCISGVTFTRQPDGYTDGLRLITAAYGHGEGVVQGSVPTDHFLLTNGYVDSSIVLKDKRIAPIKGAGLRMVNVTESSAKKPTLTEEQLRELNDICDRIEQKYDNKPLDIEWVFKDNTFYVVQVRELSKPQGPTIEPNYIADLEQTSVVDEGQLIVPGSDVREIYKPEHYIAIETLAGALRYYLAHDLKSIRAIFVTEGLETSHEANFFRWKRIPVLKVKKLVQIKDQLNKHHLVLCCQSGKLYQGDIELFTLERGWYSHPYKPILSILPNPGLLGKITAKLKEATEASSTDKLPKIKVDISNLWKDIHRHIANLRTNSDIDDVRQILTLIAKTQGVLSGLIADTSLQEELATVFANVVSACNAMADVINDQDLASSSPEEYKLQKLYAIQRLETVLNQERHQQTTNSFSLRTIIQEAALQQKYLRVINEIKEKINCKYPELKLNTQIQELLLQVLRVTSLCMNSEFKQQLINYLVFLAMYDAAAFKQICIMFRDYQRDRLLDLVINFMPTIDVTMDSPVEYMNVFDAEKKRYNIVYASPIIAELRAVQGLNHKWNTRIKLWGDPAGFEKLLLELEEFNNSFVSRIGMFDDTSDLFIKQMIISSLKTSLDIFDLSLKELSGSVLYKKAEHQAENFSRLLKPYHEVSMLMVLSVKDLSESLVTTQLATIDKLVKQIFTIAQRQNFLDTNLHPSIDFDVSQAIFTNNVATERTLEHMRSFVDIFTLAHQNFLAAIGLIQIECFNQSRLPKVIQALITKLTQRIVIPNRESGSAKAKLINWTYQYPVLNLVFNCPLANHSANINLIYDLTQISHAEFVLDLFMDPRERSENTRVSARVFKLEDHDNPFSLIKYNAILSVGQVFGQGSFKNSFLWSIDLNRIDDDSIHKFIQHIEFLMQSTFTNDRLKFSPQACYESHMFHDSFAGVGEVCINLKILDDENLMLQAIEEILQQIIHKTKFGPSGEMNLINRDFAQIADIIIRLLTSESLQTRKAIQSTLETMLQDQQLQIIIQGYSIRKTEYSAITYFYLLNKLYSVIENIESSEAVALKIQIKNIVARYKPIASDTPESILALMIQIDYEWVKMFLDSEKNRLLQITSFEDFSKQARPYQILSKLCHSDDVEYRRSIDLDWLMKYPDEIQNFLDRIIARTWRRGESTVDSGFSSIFLFDSIQFAIHPQYGELFDRLFEDDREDLFTNIMHAIDNYIPTATSSASSTSGKKSSPWNLR